MRLYHFTSRVHLHYIRQHGITIGECPVTKDKRLDHPNLTSDPLPHNQGWAISVVNKRGARITLDIPDDDDRLVTWRSLTEKYKMDKATYRQYDAAGGFGAKNWWIYQGIIPPERFIAINIYETDETGSKIESYLLRQAEKYEQYSDLMLGVGFFKGKMGFWQIETEKLNALAGVES